MWASFLLQLSLLDLECAGYPNSLLAASALSVALDSFGKHPWPSALQQYSAYVPDDIEPVRLKIKVSSPMPLTLSPLVRTWRCLLLCSNVQKYGTCMQTSVYGCHIA